MFRENYLKPNFSVYSQSINNMQEQENIYTDRNRQFIIFCIYFFFWINWSMCFNKMKQVSDKVELLLNKYEWKLLRGVMESNLRKTVIQYAFKNTGSIKALHKIWLQTRSYVQNSELRPHPRYNESEFSF